MINHEPLGQPPFVLSGRKDMSPGSRLRAKRGGPVLAPIVNGDGISTRPFDGCGVAHHDGAPLGPHDPTHLYLLAEIAFVFGYRT